MADVEDQIRAYVDRTEGELGRSEVDLPPQTRTRIRLRQIRVTVVTGSILVGAVIAAVMVIGVFSAQRHLNRPASQRHGPAQKITPLKNAAITGDLARFDVDGQINTLRLGYAPGDDTRVVLQIVDPTGDGLDYEIPRPGQLDVRSAARYIGGEMVVAGLAPINAARVVVTMTDGRRYDAPLYALPESFTKEFEAFGVVLPEAVPFTVAAYDADGRVLDTSFAPVPTSTPSVAG
jgi:hypothetical protein